MIWIVRLAVLVIELVGLFFMLKVAHDGDELCLKVGYEGMKYVAYS